MDIGDNQQGVPNRTPGRKRQTARKSTSSKRYVLAGSRPPTYEQRVNRGGDTGPRTPSERVFLLKDFFYHRATGQPLPEPEWVDELEAYPAYKFNKWEAALVFGQPYATVLCKFHSVCSGLALTQVLEEHKVLSEVQSFVLETFTSQLVNAPISESKKQLDPWARVQ